MRYQRWIRAILLLLVIVISVSWLAGVYYGTFIIVLIMTLLAGAVALLYFSPSVVLDGSGHNQDAFRGFARFVLKRPLSDWAIAAVISLCGGFLILAVSRAVSPKGAWNLEAPEAMGTMISLFVAVLAVSVLYRRHAPIDHLSDLIRFIADDLATVLRDGGSVWISFPALSIGCHSATDDDGNVDLDSMFWTMKNRLFDCLESAKTNVGFIVYDEQLTNLLFAEYHDSVGGSPRKLEKWIEIEKSMRLLVPKSNNCLVYADPMVLTNFLIVIGDVTYLIQAHGFPQYVRNRQDEFDKPIWKGHFIKSLPGLGLIAYRREDAGLAFRTTEQLRLWLEFLRTRPDLAKFAITPTPPPANP